MTIYSNLISFRVTQTELVFEFYDHFPDRPGMAPPADLKPEVRVVMTVNVLDKLAKSLADVVKQRQATAAQQTPAIGFGQEKKT
jgi:hypothetical protein